MKEISPIINWKQIIAALENNNNNNDTKETISYSDFLKNIISDNNEQVNDAFSNEEFKTEVKVDDLTIIPVTVVSYEEFMKMFSNESKNEETVVQNTKTPVSQTKQKKENLGKIPNTRSKTQRKFPVKNVKIFSFTFILFTFINLIQFFIFILCISICVCSNKTLQKIMKKT